MIHLVIIENIMEDILPLLYGCFKNADDGILDRKIFALKFYGLNHFATRFISIPSESMAFAVSADFL
jgi:hypothetical protein